MTPETTHQTQQRQPGAEIRGKRDDTEFSGNPVHVEDDSNAVGLDQGPPLDAGVVGIGVGPVIRVPTEQTITGISTRFSRKATGFKPSDCSSACLQVSFFAKVASIQTWFLTLMGSSRELEKITSTKPAFLT